MADLLFKRFLIVLALFVFTNNAFAYESSFPFPFEFGHSSDIYLDVKKPETKQIRQENQLALELLAEKGISRRPDAFVAYIRKNNAEAIKLLLDAGFDPNQNINANYPIYYAARYNRKRIIYLLLEKGADPNRDFTSPLRFTILHKDYDSSKMLIEKGADVNYTDMVLDESLLYTALKKKQYDIALLLLKNGAKLDKKSYNFINKRHLDKKFGIYVN